MKRSPAAFAEQVIEHLWSCVDEDPSQELYAILDGARDEQIFPSATGSGAPARCLYEGDISEALARAAPYLVRMRRDSMLLSQVVTQGWGNAWGIFLTSKANIDRLADHLRQFVMACDEEDNTFYFRYYDPRVFRVFLPTCTARELSELFGPVERYLVEHDEPEKVIEYTFDGEGLMRVSRADAPLRDDAAPLKEWVVIEEDEPC